MGWCDCQWLSVIQSLNLGKGTVGLCFPVFSRLYESQPGDGSRYQLIQAIYAAVSQFTDTRKPSLQELADSHHQCSHGEHSIPAHCYQERSTPLPLCHVSTQQCAARCSRNCGESAVVWLPWSAALRLVMTFHLSFSPRSHSITAMMRTRIRRIQSLARKTRSLWASLPLFPFAGRSGNIHFHSLCQGHVRNVCLQLMSFSV